MPTPKHVVPASSRAYQQARRPGAGRRAADRQACDLTEHEEEDRRHEHVAVDRVPRERADAERGGAPERGAEAGEGGAAGERAEHAEEQPHVEQVRQQDGDEVVGRVQAEQLPRPQEEEVADEVVVAAEGGEEKRQDAVALDAGQVREVVGEEVDSRDRVVDPRAQRERARGAADAIGWERRGVHRRRDRGGA